MKILVPLVAAALLLTGCTAATSTASSSTPAPTSRVTIGVTPTTEPVAMDSKLAQVFTDQQLFANNGLPDFTVGPQGKTPLSQAAYMSALRQFSKVFQTTSDGGLNVFSNVVCYGIKAGKFAEINAGMKSAIGLTSLQSIQAITLIVAQYCPAAADKISS